MRSGLTMYPKPRTLVTRTKSAPTCAPCSDCKADTPAGIPGRISMILNMNVGFPVCSCVFACPHPTQPPLECDAVWAAAIHKFCDQDERMRALKAPNEGGLQWSVEYTRHKWRQGRTTGSIGHAQHSGSGMADRRCLEEDLSSKSECMHAR